MKATFALVAGLACAGSSAGAGPVAPLPPSWAMLEVRDALPASPGERAPLDPFEARAPRPSYTIPAAEIAGFELLLNQFDRHFVGSDFDRDSNYPDIGGLRQERHTVGIFYTFLGHDRFGTADWR